MDIEIWTDVVCPWCGLGEHRLAAALERFPYRDHVRIIHRSFQLDPSAPVGVTQPVRDVLKKKYGMSDAQLEATTANIEQMAAREGLAPYHVGKNQSGNTLLAHQLAAYAESVGKGDAIWARLYHAYFGEIRSVFDVQSLVELGVDVGLDADATREALSSGRFLPKVQADIREARALACTGVPFFVIDRKFAVAGAQGPDTLLAAVSRAWGDRPAPVIPVVADGAVCGPEGCD
jgi:predicted DsbA family dithiol-disulfide isomerase